MEQNKDEAQRLGRSLEAISRQVEQDNYPPRRQKAQSLAQDQGEGPRSRGEVTAVVQRSEGELLAETRKDPNALELAPRR